MRKGLHSVYKISGDSYIGGIERGEHNVAFMNLLKIADALEMKLSEVLVSCDL